MRPSKASGSSGKRRRLGRVRLGLEDVDDEVPGFARQEPYGIGVERNRLERDAAKLTRSRPHVVGVTEEVIAGDGALDGSTTGIPACSNAAVTASGACPSGPGDALSEPQPVAAAATTSATANLASDDDGSMAGERGS